MMSQDSWDPLQHNIEIGDELIEQEQKRRIKNILKSYAGYFDPFSELIQNAMDATDRRKAYLAEDGYTRKLHITVDLYNNTFTVTDNGIGFDEQELKAFLAPDISFKDEFGDTRGNKGVGATYIAYGFDFLNFNTKSPNYNYSGKMENGRAWIEDTKGDIHKPKVIPDEPIDPYFEEVDYGSSFTLHFNKDKSYIRPRDLSYYNAETPEQWKYILMLKTPLGCVFYQEENVEPIYFDICVIDKVGNRDVSENNEATYIYPHTVINANVDIQNVEEYQQEQIKKGKAVTEFPNKFKDANGIYRFMDNDYLSGLLSNKHSDYDKLLKQYQVEAYGYFAYSTLVWDHFNDKIAKLRKGQRLLRGGVQIANNRMIQGDILTIPLTSNIGYQNQCHVVVHFKNADPDLGRKGFQPELTDLAKQVAVEIVNRFKNWRTLLRKDTGTKNDIEKETELHAWIRDLEDHEANKPITLENENFFIPEKEVSITSEPQSEQDVVALFNQLLAGGIIRGIKLLASSQKMQYDGVFKFEVKEPIENHVFDKEKNPLGVLDEKHDKEHKTRPFVLEYKYNLDALIREFKNGEKQEKDIELVVTWHLGEEWKNDYDIVSYLDNENLHQRRFHGLTHRLVSNNSYFDVIALYDLVQYLNDVEGESANQKHLYGDNIA